MPAQEESPKSNILEVAKKKRHIFLLEKIQTGKTLTSAELRELQQLEGVKHLPAGVVEQLTQVAKALKVTYRTAQRWAQDGMPRTPEGFYDLTEIQAWRMMKERGPETEETDRDKWDAEYRQYKALIAKLDYQKMIGELMPREEVEAGRVQRILALKRSFLGLPKRIAPQLIGLDARQMQVILEKRIKEILNDFAQGLI